MKKVRNNRKTRLIYAVVGDGYCEKIYFEHLKKAEQLAFDIKPELPSSVGKGGGYMSVFKKAEQMKDLPYDKVFCLVDYDVILKENNEPKYLIDKQKIEKKGIVVIELNPCFEIWFLLHFTYTAQPFQHYSNLEPLLKKHLPDYSKSQEYHQKQNL